MQHSTTLTNNNDELCPCCSCLHTTFMYNQTPWWKNPDFYSSPTCFAGCEYMTSPSYYEGHFRDHFKEGEKFKCNSPGCKQRCKRWAELERHSKSKHCLRHERFPCDVLGCKYGGKNGFLRSDKLLSHKRNVHDGKATPYQRMRKLQPKTVHDQPQARPSSQGQAGQVGDA